MDKLIITAAVTGSRPTKEMNPAAPYTPEEIADEAIACHHAGAAIAHIHVRDPETGAPSSRVELFEEVLHRIRRACDMLVNLTTSGLNLSGANLTEQRLEPVELRPDLCSLDVGSINFQDRVFLNPPEWGEAAARRMRTHGVKPELEIFEVGHVAQARALVDQGLIGAPPFFQLCMGVKWGLPATAENLLFLKNALPQGAQWSVLGVGRGQLPMIAMGILLGGHVRVGFEDNLYLAEGELAASNAQFVTRTVRLAELLQRDIASPGDARRLLGLG